MKWPRTFWTVLAGWLAAGSLLAGPPPAEWLAGSAFALKEGYDDNVFLSSVAAPPNTLAPPGSVVASKDKASWITTVSPKLSLNFASLLGATNGLPLLTLAYAPDFTIYQNESSESYSAHRLLAAAQGGWEPINFSADNNFTYIDGSGMGPFYPGGFYSAFATTADRERRRQIQDRANVSLRWNHDKWFVRPGASLLDYNLMTALLDVPGYQNYADRADVNGGMDVGYEFIPQTALTLGYRYGYQYQQQYAFSPYSAPNRYQRLLFGMEGKPWPWLNVKIVSGPDFRDYAGNSASHITPLNDPHPVKYYGEAMITATLTVKDSLSFKYKTWQWVSGVGKVPYYEGIYGLDYHRTMTDKLGLNVGGGIISWDFSGGNLPACERNDLQYTVSTGLIYTVGSHWDITLTYTWNCGRNAENDVVDPQTREFSQQLVSLGALWKF